MDTDETILILVVSSWNGRSLGVEEIRKWWFWMKRSLKKFSKNNSQHHTRYTSELTAIFRYTISYLICPNFNQTYFSMTIWEPSQKKLKKSKDGCHSYERTTRPTSKTRAWDTPSPSHKLTITSRATPVDMAATTKNIRLVICVTSPEAENTSIL